MRRRLLAAACFAGSLLLYGTPAGSDEKSAVTPDLEKQPPAAGLASSPASLPELRPMGARGPYCGIYSLLACLRAVGVDVEVRNLLTMEYVGSPQGSTASELISAAEKCGAHARCFTQLTHRELTRATTPMILHVRNNWADGGRAHWVAFLGFDGNRVSILDPPHPVGTFSPAEVLATWDGLAIAVSREPIHDTLIGEARIDFLRKERGQALNINFAGGCGRGFCWRECATTGYREAGGKWGRVSFLSLARRASTPASIASGRENGTGPILFGTILAPAASLSRTEGRPGTDPAMRLPASRQGARRRRSSRQRLARCPPQRALREAGLRRGGERQGMFSRRTSPGRGKPRRYGLWLVTFQVPLASFSNVNRHSTAGPPIWAWVREAVSVAVLSLTVGPSLIFFSAIAMLPCSRYWAMAAANGCGSTAGTLDLPQPEKSNRTIRAPTAATAIPPRGNPLIESISSVSLQRHRLRPGGVSPAARQPVPWRP